jgi:septum site-determining protein MinC
LEPTAATTTSKETSQRAPFQVRGALHTLVTLRLQAPDDPEFFPLLADKIAHAPDFFRDAPVVLDVAPCTDIEPTDLGAFCEQLRALRLIPVGIQNGTPPWMQAAREAGLAIMTSGGLQAPPTNADRRQAQSARDGRPVQGTARPRESAAPPPAPLPARGPSLVVTEPVRGGQQIIAHGGDLVLLAPVGHGAEVGAAGHIHAYGPLRGRAFAGMDGDASALIFCDQLHADLVSIAGIYLVSEDMDSALVGKRVRIACQNERIVITRLS